MSHSYNIEPPPTAKAILQTTSGDIELEIFAKQTPLAARNFLQLCLDGYYNDTIFHRLVPGFVLQGGDPTGTGDGGEAIYDGGLFADEFHSRLRFNRRGLLGMANGGRKDDNGSQFFITLGKTEQLNGSNTMFGRVVGDTIYNVMKMGEAELVSSEGSERPLYPTKITGTEVLINPFEDMVARKPKLRTPEETVVHPKKKPKKRAGKALLSFGGDEEGEVEQPVLKKAKFNTSLINASSEVEQNSPKPSLQPPKVPLRPEPNTIRAKPVLAKKLNSHPETQLPLPNDEKPSAGSSSSPEPPEVANVSSALKRTNDQIAELKASMRRSMITRVSEEPKKKSALEQMIPKNSTRGRKRGQHKDDNGPQALKMMDAFRAKLDRATISKAEDPNIQDTQKGINMAENNQASLTGGDEDDEAKLCDLHFIANCQSCRSWDNGDAKKEEQIDDDDKGWMSHILSFEKDRLGKDLNWKKKNEEELVVIDPREKAKEIKEEQRARKGARDR